MKKLLTLLVTAGALSAAGCGGDKAPKAEPAFKNPPKSQLGQIETGPGLTSGEEKVGQKVK